MIGDSIYFLRLEMALKGKKSVRRRNCFIANFYEGFVGIG